MGHLFYIHFGNVANERATPDPLFQNVQVTSIQYWTGTVLPTFPPDIMALYFNFNTGFQGGSFFTDPLFAWAVRDGDVAPSIPEYSCVGFGSPFDAPLAIGKKAKGAIPVKMKLFDEIGVEIVGVDLMTSPVINVTFNGFVYGDGTDDGALEPVGSSNNDNFFAYSEGSGYWEYRVGTKQFPATGTYTVEVRAGDNGEYIVNPSCSQTFTRKP